MTERELFLQALEIQNPAERAALVDGACAGQPQLRQSVEQLLKAHDLAGQFLNEPHPAAECTGAYVPNSPAELAGLVIAGKYKLLQQIGEGGMGAVWMADQLEPVKRRVAVKLIRTEREGSHMILSRFEAERQAIALMDHPNIAKLLDAGTTVVPGASATGGNRPFFVMELVKGTPLTQYCDENKLSITDRLKLFMQICSAVQHAHQKGIIHRDLKPTNILVESHDDKPVPKVIDFGMAKALSGQLLTEHTLFTGFGTVAGTPLYMAPEQAKFNAIDIDTRADIYALGVILYELLTGSTPIERATLKKAALDEILRVIRESEPPTPSKRLSSTDSRPSIAAVRQTEPVKLGRFVKGELDWIVMKALSKERDRRYETANGFARDIERFLNHEPIVAGPPSARYKLRKFVQRNKVQVTAACLVLLVLLAGIAGTSWGFYREARRAEGERLAKLEAEKAAAAEKMARQTAQARETETKAVLEFVENKVFAAARPKDQEGGQGYEVKLADAITAALPYVEKSFTDQPLIEARLRYTLGTSFQCLGKADVAEQQFRRAGDLFTAKLGPDHPYTLASMNKLAMSYSDLGRLQEALALREETLKLTKAKLGPDHFETLGRMNNLANSYEALGRYQEALPLLEETLKRMKAKLGPDHPYTLNSMQSLAGCYADLGRHPEALTLREEALKLLKAKLGPDHPATLRIMNNLAVNYSGLGRHQEALALREETLKLYKAKFGPDHPATLSSMNNLAQSYYALSRNPEAVALHEETLKLRKAKLGADHPDTLGSMMNLGNSYITLGRHSEALALREETLKLQKAKLGPDHPATLGSMVNLAESYKALGRLADATNLYEETLAIMKVKIPNHTFTLNCMMGLAGTYAAIGRYPEARALCEAALKRQSTKFGANHPNTVETMFDLACSFALVIAKAEDRGNQADLAMDWLQQAVAAGYKDVANMKKDINLNALREREDFKKLIAELEKAEK